MQARKHVSKRSTLALKLRTDVTRNPKRGISDPAKRTGVLQIFFFKFIYLIPGLDCSESVNLCQSGETQCTNDGLCIPRSRGFSCQCPFGYHGDRCQSSSKGFSALSYAEYIMTLDSRKNTIGQF